MNAKLTVPVYAATLVLSAFLLFSVQLLFSKMILPLLGGSPSVWNTALVFFQALLLAGYGYAHLTSHYMTIRKQALLHLGLLLVCLAFLPVAIPAGAHPDAGDNPTLWQLGIMAAVVGAPFFAISASAPMIQRWFAGTDHKDAANPYFLYAASNIGSMGALLAYPAAIEPLLTLKQQNLAWAAGYGLLLGLTALCALMVWKFRPAAARAQDIAASAPDLKTKLIWIALAFIPSSLMLGLTTYITTDIASAPLLWILPLALYLATFIIVFARREIISMETTVALFSVFFTLYLFLMSSTMFVGKPQFFLVPPTVFFFACLLCHKKLADMRPAASHLTAFYMYMSLGGVLGGMFNSFLAPVLFPVPFEYTLALCAVIIVFSAIVAARVRAAAKQLLPSLASPKFLIPAAAALALLYASLNEKSPALHILAGIFVVITLMSVRMKPAAYAAFACLVLIGVSPLMQLFDKDILTIERNFFGVIRVGNTGQTRNFVHGTTLHGAQPLAAKARLQPITYYSPRGALGDALSLLEAPEQKVSVIGLGVGAIACITRPGRSYDYYEIDPDVVKIAEDRRYFTYLSDCGSPYKTIVGDGRLKMAEAQDGIYDMVIVDAFSSDNIPVHVLTLEALQIYSKKLKPGGIMLYHISNRHLDLEPVLKVLARDAGYEAVIKMTPAEPLPENPKILYQKAIYVAMTHSPEQIATLKAKGWEDLVAPEGFRTWTDDYANIAAALRVFQKTPSRFMTESGPEK